MASLPLPAPIPPLALLGRQKRIARLGHCRGENILAANVDPFPGNAAKPAIEFDRVLARQLFHAADFQELKVAQHGWANRNQVF
jgi:hypothetical protein